MSVYKDPSIDLAVRIDCAKTALPFEKPRLSPVEPQRTPDHHVPLAERILAYTRRDCPGGGRRPEKATDTMTAKAKFFPSVALGSVRQEAALLRVTRARPRNKTTQSDTTGATRPEITGYSSPSSVRVAPCCTCAA
jgi:hypothetical protein